MADIFAWGFYLFVIAIMLFGVWYNRHTTPGFEFGSRDNDDWTPEDWTSEDWDEYFESVDVDEIVDEIEEDMEDEGEEDSE